MAKTQARTNPYDIKLSKYETRARIMLLIMFVTGIICVFALSSIIVFAFLQKAYSDPLPEIPHMITTINATGTYIEYENCDWDIAYCRIEKYLVVDKGYEKFNAYCLYPMNYPIAYTIKDIIKVSHNSDTLAQKTVLYGCNGSFVSYRGYILGNVFLGSLILLFVAGMTMAMSIFGSFVL